MIFVLLCCCCLAALCQGVLGDGEYCIKNANEMIEFSQNVSSGTSYLGTTVFLDADIDFSGGFSEQFEPIGKDDSKSFQGTFDGRGHTISDLAISSSSLQYVGLFGYSEGTAIRNVVLDSSCSVVSSYNSNSNAAYVGEIIGYCRDCTIENTVNMASVVFTGSTGSDLYLGGIAGYLEASNKDAAMRNCANYGSVTHSGNTTGIYYSTAAGIGGIIGVSQGISTNKIFIQNCLNYGTITHSGTTAIYLHLGGTLGYTYYANIENCVSGGKITSNKQDKCYIGSVVGYASSSTTTNITHCYWTSDVGCDEKACGSGNPTIDTETKQVTLNTATVNNLNNYNSLWNKWLLNTNNRSVTFKVNSGKGFNLSSQLIILPSLSESESHTFSGWFVDEECTTEFTGSSVETDTTLYGGWSYIVAFDPAGGVATASSKSVVYGQKYGQLPIATKTGYTFTGWFTEKEAGKGEKVTENDTVKKGFDHTLYAQ